MCLYSILFIFRAVGVGFAYCFVTYLSAICISNRIELVLDILRKHTTLDTSISFAESKIEDFESLFRHYFPSEFLNRKLCGLQLSRSDIDINVELPINRTM